MRAILPAALLALSAASAEPPPLVIPAKVYPVQGYVRLAPETTAKAVTYLGLSGVYPFPSDELADRRRFVLPAAGLKPGEYRFAAVGSLNDEHAVAEFVVVIAGDPAAPVPPPATPDPKPVPAPTGLYFLVVRPDGPAAPALVNTLADPAWKKLTAAGHRVKDKTVAEAKSLNVTLPDGTALPCVVTLRIEGDVSKVVAGPVPLPATGDAILKLPEGVK